MFRVEREPSFQRFSAGYNGISDLHNRICACDVCVRTGHLAAASPRAWGRAPAPFMVIGQAPSLRDSQPEQEMYSGPAGLKLRGWLNDAGFRDSDFGTTVYMTAMTKCFPGRLPGHSKDRAPSRTEQANCRPWLDAQIALVRPKLIVLFGRMAIDAFLGSGHPLDTCVGHAYCRLGTIYAPLPHSSGASTWLNTPAHRDLVARAIALIGRLRAEIVSDFPLTEELLTNL